MRCLLHLLALELFDIAPHWRWCIPAQKFGNTAAHSRWYIVVHSRWNIAADWPSCIAAHSLESIAAIENKPLGFNFSIRTQSRPWQWMARAIRWQGWDFKLYSPVHWRWYTVVRWPSGIAAHSRFRLWTRKLVRLRCYIVAHWPNCKPTKKRKQRILQNSLWLSMCD